MIQAHIPQFTFHGLRHPAFGTVTVWMTGDKTGGLDPKPSQEIINHSPDGFEWGYEGSGPAQLALAMLLQVSSKSLAVKHHHRFKREIVAGFAHSEWSYEAEALRNLIGEWETEGIDLL